MVDPASAPAQTSIAGSAVGTTAVTFAIGTVAGLASVFLLRMMLLLSIVDSLTPRREADALFEAIQLKVKKKLDPSLLQVPR